MQFYFIVTKIMFIPICMLHWYDNSDHTIRKLRIVNYIIVHTISWKQRLCLSQWAANGFLHGILFWKRKEADRKINAVTKSLLSLAPRSESRCVNVLKAWNLVTRLLIVIFISSNNGSSFCIIDRCDDATFALLNVLNDISSDVKQCI